MHMMQCVQSDQYTDSTTIKVTKTLPLRAVIYTSNHISHDKLSLQEVSKKTKELINNMKGLAPEGGKISLELLHKRKMNPATETFLYSLASAEGMTEL